MPGAEQQILGTSVAHPAIDTILGSAQWYAVRTRSRHEKRAACELSNMGVTVFLPALTVIRRWSDRNKMVVLPLFPGYLFVHTTLSVETRVSILQASGVVGIVGVRGWGTPIPDKQMNDLQILLSHEIPFETHPFLCEGQRVRVRGGCLDGVEGILVERHADRDLVISVEPIHRSIIVRISDYNVEPVWAPHDLKIPSKEQTHQSSFLSRINSAYEIH